MQAKRTHEGIKFRHSRRCAISIEAKLAREEGRERQDMDCDCEPTVEASVYSLRDKRRFTKSFTGKGALTAAKNWRT
ncbi:MAG TPA: hypothetical protein VMU58_14575, partial [Gaiellaceae bacterium]|nr:hypothetical protein [Gaiellaceae bacterium]